MGRAEVVIVVVDAAAAATDSREAWAAAIAIAGEPEAIVRHIAGLHFVLRMTSAFFDAFDLFCF